MVRGERLLDESNTKVMLLRKWRYVRPQSGRTMTHSIGHIVPVCNIGPCPAAELLLLPNGQHTWHGCAALWEGSTALGAVCRGGPVLIGMSGLKARTSALKGLAQSRIEYRDTGYRSAAMPHYPPDSETHRVAESRRRISARVAQAPRKDNMRSGSHRFWGRAPRANDKGPSVQIWVAKLSSRRAGGCTR